MFPFLEGIGFRKVSVIGTNSASLTLTHKTNPASAIVL